MNWFLILVAFGLAVLMGASASSLFATIRPQWSERQRLFASAVLLPALMLAATIAILLAVIFGGRAEDADMRDLAVATIARVGGLVVLLALVGAFVGAWLRQHGMRR